MTTQPKIIAIQTQFDPFTVTADGLVPAPATSTGKFLKDDATWSTVVSGASITNDTTTNATRYPLFADAISGTPTVQYTADTKLYFNPSTGEFSATGHTTLSDKRIKYDIKPIQNSTLIINSLQAKVFRYKDTKNKSFGLIAQDVEKILPEAITENIDNGLKSINYTVIVAHLIDYVKQLNIRIDQLEMKQNDSNI